MNCAVRKIWSLAGGLKEGRWVRGGSGLLSFDSFVANAGSAAKPANVGGLSAGELAHWMPGSRLDTRSAGRMGLAFKPKG